MSNILDENIDTIEEEDDIEDMDDTIIIEEKDHFNTSKHFTQPILTKYEKTMIIIERTQQLLNQSTPLINNAESYNSIDDIVEEELRQKKIPFIIRRSIGNQYDYYKLSDLDVL